MQMTNGKKTKKQDKKYLLLDAGNTRIKSGFLKGNSLKIKYFDSVQRFQEYIELLRTNNMSFEASVYSSVLETEITKKIEKCLLKISKKIFSVKEIAKPLFKTKYNFNQLGADRTAALSYCLEKGLFPAVIIDAGSAITIDFLKCPNIFLGGYICAGFRMEFECLHKKTANLPEIVLPEFNYKLPENTKKAISKGVYGIKASGIKLLIENVTKRYTEKPEKWKTILSGGDSSLLKKFIPGALVVDNIVLHGLKALILKNI